MEQKTKLGEFFSLREFCKSQSAERLGIKNIPTEEHVENMRTLVKEILDPVRHLLGKISISSGYRSKELNDAVGGVATSAHNTGQAADLVFSDVNKLFETIRDNFIYDQVILESLDTKSGKVFWVHVSYVKGRNRGQSFHMHNHKRTSQIIVNKLWN